MVNVHNYILNVLRLNCKLQNIYLVDTSQFALKKKKNHTKILLYIVNGIKSKIQLNQILIILIMIQKSN